MDIVIPADTAARAPRPAVQDTIQLHHALRQRQRIQHSARLHRLRIVMTKPRARVLVHNGAEHIVAHLVQHAHHHRNIIVIRKAPALVQAVSGARQQVRLLATALTRARPVHQPSLGTAT